MKQADNSLSPKVFTTAMKAIFNMFKKLPLDERVINGERLTDIRFAADVALISSKIKGMKTQLNHLNNESKEGRLEDALREKINTLQFAKTSKLKTKK